MDSEIVHINRVDYSVPKESLDLAVGLIKEIEEKLPSLEVNLETHTLEHSYMNFLYRKYSDKLETLVENDST